MCGRYFIDDDTIREAEKIVQEADRKLQRGRAWTGRAYSAGMPAASDSVYSSKTVLAASGSVCLSKTVPVAAGDVYPSNFAAVMTGRTSGFRLEGMRWGFPKYQGTGLLINARSETALERKTFRDSVLYRRCVVPAKWFYEWDSDKNKASFMKKDKTALYMAGFYNRFQDGDHFMILTTQANASVSPVHHRMPLVLEERELESWIYPETKGMDYEVARMEEQKYSVNEVILKSILNKVPPMLWREQEYEQQSLIFE